jgi:hypothetical protein
MACENAGADWLPFQPFATLKAGVNGAGSQEVLWQGGQPVPLTNQQGANKRPFAEVATHHAPPTEGS